MKRYEVVAIVKTELVEEDLNAIIERASNIITERNGVIAKVEKWGKRRLAYEIQKQKDGFYFFIDYAGNGAIVDEMERNFKIDDRVLKFMTIQKEGAVTREGMDEEIAQAEIKRTQARAENENPEARSAEASSGDARPARPTFRRINHREDSQPKGE